MKLPLVLAQSSIGVQPQPYASAQAFGGGAGAGLAAAGQAIGNAADQMALVEQRKAALAARTESANAQAQYELGLQTYDTDLRTTEADPKAYLDQSALYTKNLADQIKAGLSPQGQAQFALHAPKIAEMHLAGAYKHSNTLYQGQRDADYTNTKDATVTLAGMRPLDANGERQLAGDFATLESAADSMAPIKGAKWVTDQKIENRKTILSERSRRDVETDPAGFLTRVDTTYAKMDAEKRDIRVAAANEKIKERDREARIQRTAYEADQTKKLEADKKALVNDMNSRVGLPEGQGGLTLGEVNFRADLRHIGTEDAHRLRKEIATDEGQSDPSTLARVDELVHRAVPGIGPDGINALRDAKRLSRKDANEARDAVIRRQDHAVAEGRAIRAEGRAVVNHDLSVAEGLFRTQSGITTPFDQLDEEGKQLYASGWREIVQRSEGGGLGGKEKAGEVALEVGQKIAGIRQQRVSLQPEIVRQTMRPAFQAATPQEAAALLERAKTENRIDAGGYKAEQQKILDWNRALEKAVGVKKPTDTTKPGATDMGRKPPGTK